MSDHEDQGSNIGKDGDTIESLRIDLAATEIALSAARSQRDGANNRVKYLENLIAEAAGKAGEKR